MPIFMKHGEIHVSGVAERVELDKATDDPVLSLTYTKIRYDGSLVQGLAERAADWSPEPDTDVGKA